MEPKKWYMSKSLWLGFIAFVGGILEVTGIIEVPISPEMQLTILGVIAVILRMVTSSPIEW